MKFKIFFPILLSVIFAQSFAQPDYTKAFYAVVSGGNAMPLPFGMMGAAGYEGKGFYQIGGIYMKQLKKHKLEAGCVFAQYNIKVTPSYPEPPIPPPHISHTYLLSFPLQFRHNFGKHFFLNEGISADIEIFSNNEQSGVGILAGMGWQFNYEKGFSWFINPYFQRHHTIPIPFEGIMFGIWSIGIKTGIGFAR